MLTTLKDMLTETLGPLGPLAVVGVLGAAALAPRAILAADAGARQRAHGQLEPRERFQQLAVKDLADFLRHG